MIEKLINFGIVYVIAGSVIGLVIFGIALAVIIKFFKNINKDMEDEE